MFSIRSSKNLLKNFKLMPYNYGIINLGSVRYYQQVKDLTSDITNKLKILLKSLTLHKQNTIKDQKSILSIHQKSTNHLKRLHLIGMEKFYFFHATTLNTVKFI